MKKKQIKRLTFLVKEYLCFLKDGREDSDSISFSQNLTLSESLSSRKSVVFNYKDTHNWEDDDPSLEEMIFAALDISGKGAVSIAVSMISLSTIVEEKDQLVQRYYSSSLEDDGAEQNKIFDTMESALRLLRVFRRYKDIEGINPNWKAIIGIYEFVHYIRILEGGEVPLFIEQAERDYDNLELSTSERKEKEEKKGRAMKSISWAITGNTLDVNDVNIDNDADMDADSDVERDEETGQAVEMSSSGTTLMSRDERKQKRGVKTAGGITENVGGKMRPVTNSRATRATNAGQRGAGAGSASGRNRAGGARTMQISLVTAVTDSFVAYIQKIGIWMSKINIVWPVTWTMLTGWMEWPALGWELAILPVKGTWFYWLVLIAGLLYPVAILIILVNDDGKPTPSSRSLGHCFGFFDSLVACMRNPCGLRRKKKRHGDGDGDGDGDGSESEDEDWSNEKYFASLSSRRYGQAVDPSIPNNEDSGADGSIVTTKQASIEYLFEGGTGHGAADTKPASIYREYNRWKYARYFRSNIFGALGIIFAALCFDTAINTKYGVTEAHNRSQFTMLGWILLVLVFLNFAWTSLKVWVLKRALVRHNYSLLPAHRNMRFLVCMLIMLALRSMLFMALSAINDILLAADTSSARAFLKADVFIALVLVGPFTLVGPYAYFRFVTSFYGSIELERMRKLANGDDEVMRGLMERFAEREVESSMGTSIIVSTVLSVFNERSFHFATIQVSERILVILVSTYLASQPLTQLITLTSIEGTLILTELCMHPYSSMDHAKYSLAFRAITLTVLAMSILVHVRSGDEVVVLSADIVLVFCFFLGLAVFVMAVDLPSLLSLYRNYLVTLKFRRLQTFVMTRNDFHDFLMNKRQEHRDSAAAAAAAARAEAEAEAAVTELKGLTAGRRGSDKKVELAVESRDEDTDTDTFSSLVSMATTGEVIDTHRTIDRDSDLELGPDTVLSGGSGLGDTDTDAEMGTGTGTGAEDEMSIKECEDLERTLDLELEETKEEHEEEERRNEQGQAADYVRTMTGAEDDVEEARGADGVCPCCRLEAETFLAPVADRIKRVARILCFCGDERYEEEEEEVLSGGYRPEIEGRVRRLASDLCFRRDFFALAQPPNFANFNRFIDACENYHACLTGGWTMLQKWQYLKVVDVEPALQRQLLHYELLLTEGPLFSIAFSRVGGRIPNSIGSMLCVESLNLAGCDLSCSVEPLATMPSLRHLNLDNNLWTDVPPGLNKLTQVEVLSYRNNHLDAFLFRSSQAFVVSKKSIGIVGPGLGQDGMEVGASASAGMAPKSTSSEAEGRGSGGIAGPPSSRWQLGPANRMFFLPRGCPARIRAPFTNRTFRGAGAGAGASASRDTGGQNEGDAGGGSNEKVTVMANTYTNTSTGTGEDILSARKVRVQEAVLEELLCSAGEDLYLFGSPGRKEAESALRSRLKKLQTALMKAESAKHNKGPSLNDYLLGFGQGGGRGGAAAASSGEDGMSGGDMGAQESRGGKYNWVNYRIGVIDKETKAYLALLERLDGALRAMTNLVSVHLQGTLDGLRHPAHVMGHSGDLGELFLDGNDSGSSKGWSSKGRGRRTPVAAGHGDLLLWDRHKWYGRPVPRVPLLEQLRTRGLNLAPLYVANIPVRLLKKAGYSRQDCSAAGYPEKAIRPYYFQSGKQADHE